MSKHIQTGGGRYVEFDDNGSLWIGEQVYADTQFAMNVNLEVSQAVNLASALLQWATQNREK